MKTFGKIEIFAVIFVLTLGTFYLFFKDGGGLVATASSKSHEDYAKIVADVQAQGKELEQLSNREIKAFEQVRLQGKEQEKRIGEAAKKSGVELFAHTVDNPVVWSGKLETTPGKLRGMPLPIFFLSIDRSPLQWVVVSEIDDLNVGDVVNVYRHEKGGLYALVAPGV